MDKKILLAFAASSIMLAACGDDVTEVTNIQQSGLAVLEKGEKLSEQVCDTANVGEMLFVMDSSEAFICDGESWRTLKGIDGKDGSNGKDGIDGKDGSNGKDGVDGKDGATGEKGEKGSKGDPGADGKDGEDGMTCSAKPVESDAGLKGLEVTCGEAVIDTIWNGADGKNGDPGEPGKDGMNGKNLIAVPGTMGSFVDNRDGHVYKTVVIGSQTWMAENLNFDLKVLPEGETDSVQFSWCGGGEEGSTNEGDCSVYGRLYTWSAAVDSVAAFSDGGKGCGFGVKCEPEGDIRGICPEGWHLPDTTEWKTLFAAVGGMDVAGKMLKSGSGWKDSDGSVADSYGFSALPAGLVSSVGNFRDVGFGVYFWSASMYGDIGAYYVYLSNADDGTSLSYFNKNLGYGRSVRCILNNFSIFTF